MVKGVPCFVVARERRGLSQLAWQESLKHVEELESQARLRAQRKATAEAAASATAPHRRSESVRMLQVRSKVWEALEGTMMDWERRTLLPPSLVGLEIVDVKMSPDFRQAYVYWRDPNLETEPAVKVEKAPLPRFATLFDTKKVKVDTAAIAKDLQRINKKLRFDFTRRARLKYSPQLIFMQHRISRWTPPVKKGRKLLEAGTSSSSS